jgi:4-alpha-glucanotransferase
MRFPRSSGIVLHPTSLPGPYGIGDLGPVAYTFADFLAASGQTLWQVLPLGPTGYGDSPYQCFSALAGNPLLISPAILSDQGTIDPAALRAVPPFPQDDTDFAHVIPWKTALLNDAAERFFNRAGTAERSRYDEFCRVNKSWLADFALFMAVKRAHDGRPWTQWEAGIRSRDPQAMAGWRARSSREIAIQQFLQFAFFEQWTALRAYCHERRIRIMGDVPIYVAHDSADVWANPQNFQLDTDGNPTVVSGVPPDYFSATGQLWGNPIYRWDVLAGSGYSWWIERLRAVLKTVDLVRLDHFRGFEAYWEVPASEPTAVNGRWVKGPGAALFQALHEAMGELPLVAENLGVITPEVEAIRTQFGFPGMSILQFAFGSDPQAKTFRPHNYPHELVAYSGTHDCDTTVAWWNSEGRGESTRSQEEIRFERNMARRYLQTDGTDIHWVFIRALLASVADTVLIPLQDVLGAGNEARMNQPATLGGNWRWRYRGSVLTPEIADRLRGLSELYDRC